MSIGIQAVSRPSPPAGSCGKACHNVYHFPATERVCAYLSWKRASTYGGGCWGTRPDDQRDCHEKAPTIIGDDFEEFKRKYTEWYLSVEKACVGRTIVQWTTEGYLTQVRSVLEIMNLL